MSCNFRFRVMILLSVTMLTFVCPLCTAHADESSEWVRINGEGVFLYANNYSQKVLCILQDTYYLRVIKEEDTMLFVSLMGESSDFPAITGYVWTSQVKKVKSTPVTPYYPTEYITVKTDSAALKLSPVPSAETLVVAANTQKICFYGEIISYGETWYYVYFAGKFGYVRSSQVTMPQISPHPTPTEETTPAVSPNPTEEEEKPSDNKTFSPASEIILIAFVILLALGLALAVILPGNVKRRNDVFSRDI